MTAFTGFAVTLPYSLAGDVPDFSGLSSVFPCHALPDHAIPRLTNPDQNRPGLAVPHPTKPRLSAPHLP
ncbi:MAG: hypothetical protein ICV63_11760 [Coleofasciculus sp. Co-bin14]|nr:hypothetical protein [Coleofasciculus sp. Co-bin14]